MRWSWYIKDTIVSTEAQKIIVKKLSHDQLFVLLVLVISAVLSYSMITKITSQMDEVNIRLDKLINVNERTLSELKMDLRERDYDRG